MDSKESRILIIDDEPDICDQLSGLLNDIGYVCDKATTSEKGIEIFEKNNFSLVLLDIWLNNSKFDGFQALEKILGIDQNIPVIMISGHGNIETAVNSIKKGAYDFIEKPFDSDLLIFKIKKALENFILKKKLKDLAKKDIDSEIVAFSKSSKILEKQINEISKIDSNVILIGDNGSGKEFVASMIHNLSHRANKNFKSVDCKTEKLSLERNLFGYEENQVIKDLGILDEIDNGTIYFKNIDCFPENLQGKILRILEEKKYYRDGALNSNPLNIRVIASTSTNFRKINLRKDLLKKLNFSILEVPSLIKRKEDIEKLIEIFASKAINQKNLSVQRFSEDAISYIINLNFFKNISQLKKFVEWILVMLNSKNITEISKNDLLDTFSDLSCSNHANSEDSMSLDIKEAREQFEKKYLIYNLEKFKYNVSKMSDAIGMERTALYRKLKFLNINTEL